MLDWPWPAFTCAHTFMPPLCKEQAIERLLNTPQLYWSLKRFSMISQWYFSDCCGHQGLHQFLNRSNYPPHTYCFHCFWALVPYLVGMTAFNFLLHTLLQTPAFHCYQALISESIVIMNKALIYNRSMSQTSVVCYQHVMDLHGPATMLGESIVGPPHTFHYSFVCTISISKIYYMYTVLDTCLHISTDESACITIYIKSLRELQII